MRNRILSALLCTVLTLSLACPVLAAVPVEQEAAAAYLGELGIMVGDQSGNMNLESDLTRAHLAAVLTRLCGNQEHVAAEQDFYEGQCKFSDVPDWAKVYVGFCSFNSYMVGYGDGRFGANDAVTPAAACTVVLRYLEYTDAEWDYTTACQTALSLELTTPEAVTGTTITRGGLAVMLYRALGNTDYAGQQPPENGQAGELTKNADGSINLPSDGSQYVPQAGDVIRCDDGSNYTIIDVSRWDKNMFASGPIGPLPEPTCDWSLLEQPELPAPETKHFSDEHGEYLHIRNLYETRRMLYTLYNAIGSNTQTWENGAPKLSSKGNQLVHIYLDIPDGESYQMFWPWRECEIVDLFNSVPPGSYYMEAWDIYKNGKFLQTEYDIYTI